MQVPILIKDFTPQSILPKYLDSEFSIIYESIDSPYIYYISITDFDYLLPWGKTGKDGFSKISPSVKDDVRSGLCKIVMYAQDEGEFGSDKNIELETLEKWMILENFPKNSVHFICMNLIIDKSIIKKNMLMVGHPNVYNSEVYPISPYENSDEFVDVGLDVNHKIFLNYNKSHRFFFRIYLLLNYIKHDLLKDGLVSFSEYFKNENVNEIVENDSTLQFDSNIIDTYNKITPIYIDDILKHYFDSSEDDTSIHDNLGQIVNPIHYNKTFVSVVSETLVREDTIYLSEKTFKPILMGHPFIIVSSTGTLKKLKELGYKTFDKWWDESYDECESYRERIDSIILIVKELQKKTSKERIQMRTEMLDVLKYNQKLHQDRCKRPDPFGNIVKDIYKKLLNENNISYGV